MWYRQTASSRRQKSHETRESRTPSRILPPRASPPRPTVSLCRSLRGATSPRPAADSSDTASASRRFPFGGAFCPSPSRRPRGTSGPSTMCSVARTQCTLAAIRTGSRPFPSGTSWSKKRRGTSTPRPACEGSRRKRPSRPATSALVWPCGVASASNPCARRRCWPPTARRRLAAVAAPRNKPSRRAPRPPEPRKRRRGPRQQQQSLCTLAMASSAASTSAALATARRQTCPPNWRAPPRPRAAAAPRGPAGRRRRRWPPTGHRACRHRPPVPTAV
mmetsp:Transcript_65566/g.176498  ORF Transcript_65566/g.176498 Transcript_65566/m.176498 type:complete len:276 (-) Transcript_65566:259-1086(-)